MNNILVKPKEKEISMHCSVKKIWAHDLNLSHPRGRKKNILKFQPMSDKTTGQINYMRVSFFPPDLQMMKA